MPPGGSLTARELWGYMLVAGDHTACDVLLRLAGGAAAATGRLRALEIPDIDVSRGEGAARFGLLRRDVATARGGLDAGPAQPVHSRSAGGATACRGKALDGRSTRYRDVRWPGCGCCSSALSGGSAETGERRAALGPHDAITTGPERLRGLLPPETVVAHRTGTYEESAAANDVGIITLPGRSGHIAIAVFVKASRLDPSGRERVMARIARTVYDFWKR